MRAAWSIGGWPSASDRGWPPGRRRWSTSCPGCRATSSAQAPLAEALVTATTGLVTERSGRRAGGRPTRVGGGQHRVVPTAPGPAAVPLGAAGGQPRRRGQRGHQPSRRGRARHAARVDERPGARPVRPAHLETTQPGGHDVRLPASAPTSSALEQRFDFPPDEFRLWVLAARAHPPGPVHRGAVDAPPTSAALVERSARRSAEPDARQLAVRRPCAHAGPGRGPSPAGRGRAAGPASPPPSSGPR